MIRQEERSLTFAQKLSSQAIAALDVGKVVRTTEVGCPFYEPRCSCELKVSTLRGSTNRTLVENDR